MNSIYIEMNNKNPFDDGQVMAATTAGMASIAMGRWRWADVYALLRKGNEEAAFKLVENTLHEMVPEEGDLHPKRATAELDPDGEIALETPGGVLVTFSKAGVFVEFRRDSKSLYAEIMWNIWPCRSYISKISVINEWGGAKQLHTTRELLAAITAAQMPLFAAAAE